MIEENDLFSEVLAVEFENDISSYINEIPDYYNAYTMSFLRKIDEAERIAEGRFKGIFKKAKIAVAAAAASLIICHTTGINIFMNTTADIADPIRVVIDHLSDHDDIHIYRIPEDAPKKIEDEYTIEIPEGFYLKIDYSRLVYCVDRRYTNGINEIDFYQNLLEDYSPSIDNETSVYEEVYDKKGIKYYIYSWPTESRECYIFWVNYGYAFTVRTTLGRDKTLELCKTTKMK